MKNYSCNHSYVFTLFLACILLIGVNTADAAMILSFDSSEESWVGQGESFTVTPDDGYIFTGEVGYNNHLEFSIDSLNSPFGPDWGDGEEYHYWDLRLAAPYGEPIEIGHYDNAARFPFQEEYQPGLTFSGNHRGNNRNSGFFDVLEIVFDDADNLSAFAVNFTQFGEENPDWWIHGQLRFNSDVPLDVARVPEPATISILLTGLLTGIVFIRRRAQG